MIKTMMLITIGVTIAQDKLSYNNDTNSTDDNPSLGENTTIDNGGLSGFI